MLHYIPTATSTIQHEESAILMTTNHPRTGADTPPETLYVLYRIISRTTNSIRYNCDVIAILLSQTLIDWLTNSVELSPSWRVNSCWSTQNFPAFKGTWKFIIVFTAARHWMPSWASRFQSTHSHSISLIFYTHLFLGLPSDLFPSYFPTETFYIFLFYYLRVICHVTFIILDLIMSQISPDEIIMSVVLKHFWHL
jgi:hypothetical protein